MSDLAIRVPELEIEAFRGIPGVLKLDLSAPLTLIYAANGTGKTTVCDAAEWVLTGQVSRLGVRLRARESGLLRCRLSGYEHETRVSSRIGAEGTSMALRRSLTEWSMVDDKGVSLAGSPSEILSRLVPLDLSQQGHHATTIASRQVWLRGTRFLSGEALSVLLDADPRLVEARVRVFADLLGVQHLFDTERCLRQYRDRLRPHISELGARRDKLRSERDALRVGLTAAESECTAVLVRVKAELDQVFGLLEAGSRSGDTGAGQCTTLRVSWSLAMGTLARQASLFDGRRAAEAVVMRTWDGWQVLRRHLGEHQTAQHHLDSRVRSMRTELGGLEEAIRAGETQEERARFEIQAVQSLRGDLASGLDCALRALSVAMENAPSLPQELSVAELRRRVPEADTGPCSIADSQRRVRDLANELGDRLRDWHALQALDRRLVGLEAAAPTAQQIVRLEEGARLSRETAGRVRAERDAAALPVERLRAAARAALDSLARECVCPVCGHDWEAADALLRAIDRRLAAVPSAASLLHARAISAEAASEDAKSALDDARALVTEVSDLQASAADLRARWCAYVSQVDEAGLDAGADNLQDKLAAKLRRLELAGSLGSLLAVVKRVETVLGSTFPEGLSFLALRERVDEALQERECALRVSMGQSRLEVRSLGDSHQRLQSQLECLTRELEAVLCRVATEIEEAEEFMVAWRQIAGEAETTDAALTGVRAGIRADADRLAQAKAQLASVDAQLAGLEILDEVREKDLALDSVHARLRRLEARQGSASQAMRAFRTQRETYTEKQIRSLEQVLSTLFARVQANEVFDAVRVSGGEGSLSWRGLVEGHSLDPGGHFSQGQRWDLALAIFLARARSLGGTFFLDEPVGHLDDLNRVALLDVFRLLAIEDGSNLNLVLTTASRPLLRHMVEKFERVECGRGRDGAGPLLRVIELRGNPRVGVTTSETREVGCLV